MTYTWGHERRFNSYSEYFKREFGTRVQKLSLDVGFTCPNRDGNVGRGGCTYCNNDAFNPSYCTPDKTVTQQLQEGVDFHAVRYKRAGSYLAYFQAYSNTYAEISRLRNLYEEALAFPGVIGLVIGTRPDCMTEQLLDYLSGINSHSYVMVEYGVETMNLASLKRINRGHTVAQSIAAIRQTANRGLRVGAHMIIGLPGESREDILNDAGKLSALPLHSLKLHQLQIIRDTHMERQYRQDPGQFKFFSLEEYVDFVVDYLELLNPSLVVERFAGEVPPRFLAGPGWGLIRNDQVLTMVEKRLEERNTFQGRLFNGKQSTRPPCPPKRGVLSLPQ